MATQRIAVVAGGGSGIGQGCALQLAAEGWHVVLVGRNSDKLVATEALMATIATTQKVARAVKAALDAPGVMIVQLNGAPAGQTVFHLHFHIIPRSEGLQLKFHARDMEKPEVLAAMAERIREEMEI